MPENNSLFSVRKDLALVLASASPRRQKFLASLGLVFAIHPVADEPRPQKNMDPHAYVGEAARAKALACQAQLPKSSSLAIIGADTVVLFAGQILGKPQNHLEAREMLLAQNGGTSTVISAAHLILPNGKEVSLVDEAKAYFAKWTDEIITAYAMSQEPLDKAGAFAIQENGAFLIDRIEGNYLTIVGMPGTALVAALLEHGIIHVARP